MILEQNNPKWAIQIFMDSSFPCGAFAHSQGVEAYYQTGNVINDNDLKSFIQANSYQLYVQFKAIFKHTFTYPDALQQTDATTDCFLSNHIAKGASLKQGRALLKVATEIFEIESLHKAQRLLDEQKIKGHQIPILAYIFKELGCTYNESETNWLFLHIRGLVSASVRLNVIGPTRSMRLILEMQDTVLTWIQSPKLQKQLDMPLTYAAQISPFVDITQGSQDRLYSRLFQS